MMARCSSGCSLAPSAGTAVSEQGVHGDAAEICPLPWLLVMLQTSSGISNLQDTEIGLSRRSGPGLPESNL